MIEKLLYTRVLYIIMIKNTAELIEEIRKRMTAKYGACVIDYPLKYQLRWLGRHRVQVLAWQEKWRSTINNIEFIVMMTKNAMRENEIELYRWISDRVQASQLDMFLYPNKRVYQNYEKRRI